MRILDISVAVHDGMVVWPGLVATRLIPHERISEGDAVNVTNISSCTHVGTHVDAPFHHFRDGATVDRIPLSRFVGKAFVADFTDVEWAIDKAAVERALAGAEPFEILVMKTRNSTELRTWERFDERYVHIAPDGAEEIARRGIRTVAFDHLGVEGFSARGGPTHKILLGKADVAIMEGVDLSGIKPGYYFFCAAPQKLVGSDGAPARAMLIDDPSGALLAGWNSAKEATETQHKQRSGM
jgi:arylformamidase